MACQERMAYVDAGVRVAVLRRVAFDQVPLVQKPGFLAQGAVRGPEPKGALV